MPIDAEIKQTLVDRGVDDLLANHIAHLFIRDPLVVFSETIHQDDSISSDHFEVRRQSRARLTPAEHLVDQLADDALQAAPARLAHRLAGRVSTDGGPIDRL